MNVVGGGVTGAAHLTQDLPGAYRLAFRYAEFVHMRIERDEFVAMIDHYHLAIAAHPAGITHFARRGGYERRAEIRADIL